MRWNTSGVQWTQMGMWEHRAYSVWRFTLMQDRRISGGEMIYELVYWGRRTVELRFRSVK